MPLRETIQDHHLKFTGESVLVPKEKPENSFVMYETKIRSCTLDQVHFSSTQRFRNAVRNDKTSFFEQKI